MNNTIRKIAIAVMLVAGCFSASEAEVFTASTNVPEARDVKVDICGIKYDMTRDDDGWWSAVTRPLVVGFHYYFLVVDGVSVIDPSSEAFYGCGRMSSLMPVPACMFPTCITATQLRGRFVGRL